MKRWLRAQRAEVRWQASFWAHHSRPPLIQEHIYNALAPIRVTDISRGRVLEVGCGPNGLIEASDANLRVGVDPLIQFYATLPGKPASETEYVRAVGEFLPFVEATFEAVFCINVLDHMARPELAAAEITRVSKPKSSLLLVLNVLRGQNKMIRKFLDLIDTPHPHHMTAGEAQTLFREGFSETQPTILKGVWADNKVVGFIKSLFYDRAFFAFIRLDTRRVRS